MNKSWSTAPGIIKGYAGAVALYLLINLLTTVYKVAATDAGSATMSDGVVSAIKAVSLVVAVGFLVIIAVIYGWLIYKLCRGRKWAWIVLLVLESIFLLANLIELMSGSLLSLFLTIIQVVTLGLLVMPGARDYVQDNGMAPVWNGPWSQDYRASSPAFERSPDRAE